jgi:hypothetical protein
VGQNVVVENRPGGGGNIGAAAAAKSAPDGITIHFGAQTLGVNVTLQPSKEFDPVKDFDPIMLVATAQDVLLVPPNSPFKSVQELIDYAKAHPGELNYASLGTGTSGHLATVMFADLAGIKLQHVPYTTVSQATTDVISGRIAVFLPTLGGHIGNVTAGRMRALAVSGATRAAQLPDVRLLTPGTAARDRANIPALHEDRAFRSRSEHMAYWLMKTGARGILLGRRNQARRQGRVVDRRAQLHRPPASQGDEEGRSGRSSSHR